jgi:hypothetical protein
MAHLSSVVKEIKDIKALYAKRGANPVVCGLVDSVTAKIGTVLNWDSGSAVALDDAVLDASLNEDLTKMLRDAADKRTGHMVTCTTQLRKSSGAPPRDQSLKACYNYFTRKDYHILDDPMTFKAKRDSIVVIRLDRLGIRRASEERLIKWVIVLLLDVEFKISGRYPSYWEIYDRARAIVKDIATLAPYAGPFLDKYPDEPQDLLAAVYAIAYDANDPPIQRYIHNFDALGEHVPLRKSSKLLQKGIEQHQSKHHMEELLSTLRGGDAHCAYRDTWGYDDHRHKDSRSSWSSWGSQSDWWGNEEASYRNTWTVPATDDARWKQPTHSSWGADAVVKTEHTPDTDLLDFKPTLRRLTCKQPFVGDGLVAPKDEKLVAPKGENADPTKSGAHVEAKTEKSAREIEDDAYLALVTEKGKKAKQKKEKAAEQAKDKAAEKAKGKAAPTRKRPASVIGKTLALAYKVKWEKDDKQRSRNVFNCKHYNRAKTIFKGKHPKAADEDRKATLSVVTASASEVYTKHMGA